MPKLNRQPSNSYFIPRMILLIIFWLLGFFWFVEQVPTEAVPHEESLDAVVVLTGGKGRIDEGAKLLIQHKAKKMLISGVGPKTTLDDLIKNSSTITAAEIAPYRQHITLGRLATNTSSNATETEIWVRLQNIRSLYLVTGNYHMKRSMAEFAYNMPDIKVVPQPLIADTVMLERLLQFPRSLLLLALEYSKFMALHIKILLDKWYIFLQ